MMYRDNVASYQHTNSHTRTHTHTHTITAYKNYLHQHYRSTDIDCGGATLADGATSRQWRKKVTKVIHYVSMLYCTTYRFNDLRASVPV